MFDLTGFQRDLVYVVAGLDQPSGQDIKAELEQERDTVTRGQLYPNLDAMVDKGYLEKGQVNRRTNYYELTATGQQALRDRQTWEKQYLPVEAST